MPGHHASLAINHNAGKSTLPPISNAAEPKVIVIDPFITFGRPVLAGTGIPTAIVAERYKAGESIKELAQDYDLLPQAVQEAIRCELETTAA
jgi:uncharacterized protein (DUF433 family)